MANNGIPDDNFSLTIKIEYKEYITLSEFKEAIDGWNNQFNSHIAQGNDDEKTDKLLIKEIKKGSIEITLIPALIPLISDVNTIINFFKAIKALFIWLGAKAGTKPNLSVNDLNNAKKMIAPVNNKDGRQITFSIEGGKNTFIIDSVLAKTITRNANEELSAIATPVELPGVDMDKKNVIFKLTQIKDDENPTKNTKGVIQEIDSKEHLVLFSDVEIKETILRESSNPFRKNYLVDIKINSANDVIKSYTILILHDSYIDEEDEGIGLFS
jgi:hypothetical protein